MDINNNINPNVSLNRGSFRNDRLNFDLDDLPFLSFSEDLNVLDLYVFFAILRDSQN